MDTQRIMIANDLELDEDDARSNGTSRYVPTPEQIRQACAEIRSQWSEGESLRRGAYLKPTDAQSAVGVGH